MTPAFTVCLPHKLNDGNNRALAIALDCLMYNTEHDFKLIMAAVTGGNLYQTVNDMVKQVDTEAWVYLASDTFMAVGWDTPMLELWNRDTIVTGVLVEPGAIGIHPMNLHADFGRKPETFRREEFEAWCKTAPVPNGRGWPCPYMISRSAFLDMGGFKTDLQGDMHGFTPADMVFWDEWEASGRKIQRARSFAYHLQRWSEVEEQIAEKRNT